MASTMISNPVTSTDRGREVTRKRRMKKSQNARDQTQNPSDTHNTTTQWKSEAQQQVYSSKLLQALRRVRLSSSPSVPIPRRGRAVHEAADQVLAVTAKGRTRWSRAILTNRLKLKFMKNKRRRVTVTGNSRPSKKPKVSILRLKTKNLPDFQRKLRYLGRIVPGCRKQPLPVILEEATDYIPALEMQIKAMSALADLFSGAGSLSQFNSSLPPPT